MNVTKNKTARFNIVDGLIILIILMLLAFTLYVFILGNDFADIYSQKTQITYTVCLNSDNMVEGESISVNDTVYHWNKNKNTGVVTNVETKENLDGVEYDTFVTVSVTARKFNNTYYVNGKRIEKDALINIYFSKFDASQPVKCIMVKAE